MEAHMLLGKNQASVKNGETEKWRNGENSVGNAQVLIFNSVPAKRYELPTLENNLIADVYDEIELLGFPVTNSYFDLLETKFRGDILAYEMASSVGKVIRMLGLLVTIKYVRTIKKEWMHFGTFIDVNGRFFDTVHFPKSVTQYPFRGDGVYLVKGKIVEEFGFPSMNVEQMAKMPLKGDPRG